MDRDSSTSECKQKLEWHDGVKFEAGTPEQQAKALHYYLDWIRACKKRKDDDRGVDIEQLLIRCIQGYELTENFPTHYNGD